MKKVILSIVASICFLFFGCFLDNFGQNDDNEGDNETGTISHNISLAGANHHYTTGCSKCHGDTSVSCDSCHTGSCKGCH